MFAAQSNENENKVNKTFLQFCCEFLKISENMTNDLIFVVIRNVSYYMYTLKNVCNTYLLFGGSFLVNCKLYSMQNRSWAS